MTIIVEDTLPLPVSMYSYQKVALVYSTYRIRFEASHHSHVMLLVSCYEIYYSMYMR